MDDVKIEIGQVRKTDGTGALLYQEHKGRVIRLSDVVWVSPLEYRKHISTKYGAVLHRIDVRLRIRGAEIPETFNLVRLEWAALEAKYASLGEYKFPNATATELNQVMKDRAEEIYESILNGM